MEIQTKTNASEMRNEALPNIRNKMFEFTTLNKKIQELTFKS